MSQDSGEHGQDERSAPPPFRESAVAATTQSPAVSISIDDSEVETTEKSDEAVRPMRSLVWASLYGLGGALIWATVTAVTEYELGLVAVVLGLLVGNGAAKGGRGQIAQVIGASVAAMSFLLAKLLAVVFIVLSNVDGSSTAQADGKAAQEEWIEGPSVPSQPAGASPPLESPSPAEEVPPAAGSDESAGATPQAPIGLGEILVALMTEILKETFTTLSGLFFGFAVWEGYRIPRRTQ